MHFKSQVADSAKLILRSVFACKVDHVQASEGCLGVEEKMGPSICALSVNEGKVHVTTLINSHD